MSEVLEMSETQSLAIRSVQVALAKCTVAGVALLGHDLVMFAFSLAAFQEAGKISASSAETVHDIAVELHKRGVGDFNSAIRDMRLAFNLAEETM